MACISASVSTDGSAEVVSVSELQNRLDKALGAYKSAPNAHTLLSLNKAALPLMAATPLEKPWRLVNLSAGDSGNGSNPIACDFTAIRVVADVGLGFTDTLRLAGGLACALQATLVGDTLGERSVQYSRCKKKEGDGPVFTIIEFAYNAQSSTRTRPNAGRAFEVARDYIANGSPLRTTDREGAGTMNTRLAEGISTAANLTFYVR